MDDLYGNLPPSAADLTTQGGASTSGSSSSPPSSAVLVQSDASSLVPGGVALTGWSKQKGTATLDDSPNLIITNSVISSHQSQVTNRGGGAGAPQAAKPLPPKVLPFRPRQTNAAVAAAAAGAQKQVASTGSGLSSVSALSHRNPGVAIPSNVESARAPLSETTKQVDKNPCNFDVDDPYDPAKPNDYIEWCKARLERKRMLRLEEENRAQLEERRKAEKQMEEERSSALAAGDLDKVQASMGLGRGRGRLSNLPAWMTSGAVGGSSSSSSSSAAAAAAGTELGIDSDYGIDASISTAPSCILLLNNIARKEELDSPEEKQALESEIGVECNKYGPVRDCKVSFNTFQNRLNVDEVSCFVVFERLDGAVQALRGLDGRFFGGHRISASFYPEALYFSDRQ